MLPAKILLLIVWEAQATLRCLKVSYGRMGASFMAALNVFAFLYRDLM